MSITIDPQLVGAYDDGTEDGAVRAKLVRGDLVAVPFRAGWYRADEGGSATVVHNYAGATSNRDGSMSSLLVTVPAGTIGSPSAVRIWQRFSGRVFGLRFYIPGSATTAFTCVIDGVSYQVAARGTRLVNEGETPYDEAAVIVADDLAEGEHEAELRFPLNTSTQKTWTLHGFLLERRAGYREPAPTLQPGTTTLVTTQQMLVPLGASAQTNVRAVRGLAFVNTAPPASGGTVPTAASGSAVAGAGLGIGDYVYAVTYVTPAAGGQYAETGAGAPLALTTTNGNQQVALTGIPTGPTGTVARRIYRTKLTSGTLNSGSTSTLWGCGSGFPSLVPGVPVLITHSATPGVTVPIIFNSNGSVISSPALPFTPSNGDTISQLGPLGYVGTIADNTTTTYTDSTADSALGVAPPGTTALVQLMEDVSSSNHKPLWQRYLAAGEAYLLDFGQLTAISQSSMVAAGGIALQTNVFGTVYVTPLGGL